MQRSASYAKQKAELLEATFDDAAKVTVVEKQSDGSWVLALQAKLTKGNDTIIHKQWPVVLKKIFETWDPKLKKLPFIKSFEHRDAHGEGGEDLVAIKIVIHPWVDYVRVVLEALALLVKTTASIGAFVSLGFLAYHLTMQVT